MTPEEFEKIKQAEKKHLYEIRKLKEMARQLERQKKVSGAISDLTSSMQEKLDVHDEMINRVAVDSALNEARLELALEQSEEADKKAQMAQDEADLAQARAKSVVDAMRAGDPSMERKSVPTGRKKKPRMSDSAESIDRTGRRGNKPEESNAARANPELKSKPHDDLPEKTIGRMKP